MESIISKIESPPANLRAMTQKNFYKTITLSDQNQDPPMAVNKSPYMSNLRINIL